MVPPLPSCAPASARDEFTDARVLKNCTAPAAYWHCRYCLQSAIALLVTSCCPTLYISRYKSYLRALFSWTGITWHLLNSLGSWDFHHIVNFIALLFNMLQTFEPAQSTPLHYAAAPTPPISTPVSPSPASSVKTAIPMGAPNHHHIFIVTGPAGCGKSTVAKFLAERYGFFYIEGDDVGSSCWHRIHSLTLE